MIYMDWSEEKGKEQGKYNMNRRDVIDGLKVLMIMLSCLYSTYIHSLACESTVPSSALILMGPPFHLIQYHLLFLRVSLTLIILSIFSYFYNYNQTKKTNFYKPFSISLKLWFLMDLQNYVLKHKYITHYTKIIPPPLIKKKRSHKWI